MNKLLTELCLCRQTKPREWKVKVKVSFPARTLSQKGSRYLIFLILFFSKVMGGGGGGTDYERERDNSEADVFCLVHAKV